MAFIETDIEVVQRQTFEMTLTWTDDSTPAVPVSLSGYRAHMQIRRKAGAIGTPWVDIASDGVAPAITLEPGGLTGVVAVRIPATATAALTRNGWYDIFLVKTTDATQAVRLAKGQVLVDASVTVNSS